MYKNGTLGRRRKKNFDLIKWRRCLRCSRPTSRIRNGRANGHIHAVFVQRDLSLGVSLSHYLLFHSILSACIIALLPHFYCIPTELIHLTLYCSICILGRISRFDLLHSANLQHSAHNSFVN